MKLSLLVLIFTLSLNACRKSTDQKIDDTLNIDLSGNISSLDPALSYDVISGLVLGQVYETLFEYHYLKRPFELTPLLAESMPEVSKDKLTYTFKIKKGIFYHPDACLQGGPREIKAQDFITAIKRVAFIPTKSNGWFLFDGKIKGLDEFRKQAGDDLKKFASLPVAGLQATDDYTLKVQLTGIYPQLLYAFALNFSSPIPVEMVNCYRNDLSEHFAGTGPYKIDAFNLQSFVDMTANPNYRAATYPSQGDRLSNTEALLADAGKRIPFVKKIRFDVIKEEQTRWLSFMSGKLDLLTVPKDNFSSAFTNRGALTDELVEKGIKLQITPSMTYWWISFNLREPVFKNNKNLRLAIAHAINVDRFIELFTNNTGQKANSIYPPGIPGYSPANKLPYAYDVEKARALLAKAGYPKGKGLPPLTFETRRNDTTARQMAEFVRKELDELGIKVEVVMNNFPQYLEKARTGKLGHMYLDGWALDYPDAENVLQLLSSQSFPPGPNSNYYQNAEFDKHFAQLKLMDNDEKKFQYMVMMEEIVQNDVPWVMLYYDRRYILYYDKVKNYRYGPFTYNYMKYLRLEENSAY